MKKPDYTVLLIPIAIWMLIVMGLLAIIASSGLAGSPVERVRHLDDGRTVVCLEEAGIAHAISCDWASARRAR